MNRILAIILVTLALGISAAAAQSFPSRPVRIIVGFAAGGATDFVSRVLALRLGELWEQPVIVENRPGASGMIAGGVVAKSPPDGHTILVTPQASLVVAPVLYKAPYDTAKDFTPITLASSVPLLMVVHPSLPVKTFKEFVELAKRRGTSLTYGSGSVGSAAHFAGELMNIALGIKMNHVPYKGENPALADTMSGQIEIMFGNLPTALPYAKSGRLRPLATTGTNRSPLAPEIPTVLEFGIKDYSIVTWAAVLGPAGMPADLTARIHRDIARVVNQPENRERLMNMGFDIIANTPEEFSNLLRAEAVRHAKIIKEAGIRAD